MNWGWCLTIFPGHIQENHSVRPIKTKFQHFHYWGRCLFPRLHHTILSVALNWCCQVLPAFLMEFHKFSFPLSFWASHTLCQYQVHGFQLSLLIGTRAVHRKDFFEVIHTSDFPSVIAMNNFSSFLFVRHISPIYSPAEMLHLFCLCYCLAVALPLYLLYFSSFSVFPYKSFH